jgi:hypothetical protein
MLDKKEFEDWIKESHEEYSNTQQKYDAYLLAKKWVHQWLYFGKFVIEPKDMITAERLVKEFKVASFGAKFNEFVSEKIKVGESSDIGTAVSLYLLTWNSQRFKAYFRTYAEFDLKNYFEQLGFFLENKRDILKAFCEKALVSTQLNRDGIEKLFEAVNGKLKELGEGYNEPVGTAKVLHVFAPDFFPLIDNDEAKALGLIGDKESITHRQYITWMIMLRNWLLNFTDVIEKLEKLYNSSIIRLVDEGLFLIKHNHEKVAELGIKGEG